jgi:hypothetical protein
MPVYAAKIECNTDMLKILLASQVKGESDFISDFYDFLLIKPSPIIEAPPLLETPFRKTDMKDVLEDPLISQTF